MKRILLATPQLPYPPTSGGTIKSWKLLSYLAERYEVSLYCPLKGEDASHQDDMRARVRLRDYGAVALDVPRSGANWLKSLVAGMPLNLYRNRSPELGRRIAAGAHAHDVFLVDHYEMFQYLPADYRGRVILHAHNATNVMWRRLAVVESSPLKRLAIGMEARRIRAYEQRICRRADVVLAAPSDIEGLRAADVPATKFRPTYHLGDDALLDAPASRYEETGLTLLFVGTLTWEANVDGLLWFLAECWPALVKRHPGLDLVIIGKNPDPRLRAAAAGPGVRLTGFVDDLEPFYRRARVFICPLRFGSGIKVKIVNAMYRGIPTATTSVGAEGLDVDRRHMAVADDAAGLVDGVSRLLVDGEAWAGMQQHARRLAAERYTWATVFDEVEGALHGN